jgi:hypothetical protein
MILILYPRVLAVPPIPQRPLIFIFTFIPEGIGGAANTPEAPHIYFYFHTQGILAVPPIPQGPLIFIIIFIPKGYWAIGGAANILGLASQCAAI